MYVCLFLSVMVVFVPSVRSFNVVSTIGVRASVAASRLSLASGPRLVESSVLLKSFCAQKFRLEECFEHESESCVVELLDNGEIVSDVLDSPITLLRGTWVLGQNNELRMTLERTFRGKFTDYTTTSYLVGAVDADRGIPLLVGEVRDEENPSMTVGNFYMVPWSSLDLVEPSAKLAAELAT